MIGEFKFSVPTQDFEIFLDKLRHAPLRKFSDGQEYFKIHGFYHCLVLMPDQKDRLLGLMNSMAAEVSRKADRADRDLMSRVQCLHEKGVLSK